MFPCHASPMFRHVTCVQVNVQIMMASVPMLPGVKELLEDGIESTAVTSNSYYLQYVEQGASIVTEIGGNVLLDPQTSGAIIVWALLHFCFLCSTPCLCLQGVCYSASQTTCVTLSSAICVLHNTVLQL